MDLERIAWNNFCKTGDIQSFLEYKEFENNRYIEKNMADNEVMINEVNKSKRDSN